MTLREMGIKGEDLRFWGIGHYQKVLDTKYEEGAIIYVAGTPYGSNYNGFKKGTYRAYVCSKGRIQILFCNLKYRRAMQAIVAWTKGDVGTVIPWYVWENYITNGYNTRRGLYVDYSVKEYKIRVVARSHADYLGQETGNSSFDHQQRVKMRNCG